MAEAQTWPVDGIGVKDSGCGQCGAAAPEPSLAVRSASQGALVCAFDPEQSQICADQKKTLLS